ncbi:MAG TPA: Gfo/Idh/MocA family oxidoreductase [Bryobacteraceae bacterium]|nr:Gfo/Idh/MocA family oxidoreductase [Bryobacteraceae bacterium]
MARKIRFGVLGAARIATVRVIPGMKTCELAEVAAIASRDIGKAREAASQLGIEKAYGSYEDLLADPEIDAIYNPLPNHLHVPWSIRAMEAGKHVLCEKPIGMNREEALQMIAARDRTGVKAGEAFMVRVHPQWLRTAEIVRAGEIGDLLTMHCVFGYFNRDAANIRNRPEYGGGALMDIGCYPIFFARWIFGCEPRRVSGRIERDPDFGTDRTTSGLLEFPNGQALFTTSTQMNPYQRAQFFGTKGYVEVEIPVNAPPEREARIFVRVGTEDRTETFPICNQYGLQGDAFARAILDGGEVPVSLENAAGNMAVIDSLLASVR